MDLHFDLPRLSVLECIAQRLPRDAIDFVSQDRTQVSRCAFHLHAEFDGILVGRIGREFFSDRSDGQGKIVRLDRGGTQPLHGIPALGDRLSGLIDRAIEFFFGVARGKQVETVWKRSKSP